jgi:flagellar hook-length control protein FliK
LGKITPNAANQVQTVQSGTDAGSVDPSAQGKSSQATDTRDPVAAIAADASQASPTAGIDPAQQALAGIFAAQSAAQGGAAREATSLSPQAKGKGSADTLAPADTRITPASDARRAAAKSSDADLVAALGTAPAASAAPARAGLSPLNTVIPSGDLASATTAPATDANASPFANLMQNAIQNTSGISAGAPAYPLSTSIAPQLGTPAFTQELGQGLVSMAHRGSQSVELSLNPTELGPIRVDIQMAGQTASLSMSAAHEATRTALTQALPQLHEMFAQSGLTLGQAQVGDGGQSAGRDAQPSRNARGNTRELTPEPTNTERLASSATAARIPRLIDTFA